MFSFVKQTATAVAEPPKASDIVEKPVLPPRPTPKTDRPAPIAGIDEYWALATELDIAPAKTGRVLQRRVADFLWENNIEMFSVDEVEKYMTALAKQNDAVFVWRPLRDKDIPTSEMYGGWGWHGNEDKEKHGHYWMKEWICRPYGETVPFEILKHVKMLEDKFPGNLHFFVTDYAKPGDPFICCAARDMSKIIFGVWDEPSFFKTKKED